MIFSVNRIHLHKLPFLIEVCLFDSAFICHIIKLPNMTRLLSTRLLTFFLLRDLTFLSKGGNAAKYKVTLRVARF